MIGYKAQVFELAPVLDNKIYGPMASRLITSLNLLSKMVFIGVLNLAITWLNNHLNAIDFWEAFSMSAIVPLVHLIGYSLLEGMDADIVSWKYFWIYSSLLIIVLQLSEVYFP